VLGWGLLLGVVAIAGMPPARIFMSEFLVISSTFARQPLLAIRWCRLADRVRRAVPPPRGIRFREPQGQQRRVEASYVPLFAHLGWSWSRHHLPAMVAWFQHVAGLLG